MKARLTAVGFQGREGRARPTRRTRGTGNVLYVGKLLKPGWLRFPKRKLHNALFFHWHAGYVQMFSHAQSEAKEPNS